VPRSRWSGNRTASGRPVRRRRCASRVGAAPDCQGQIDDRTIWLSPWHGVIAVPLGDHPEGLTGDQLVIELYADDVQTSPCVSR
jgi:hypothetical protein